MSEPAATEPTDGQQQGEPADKPLGENGEKALKAERDRAKALEKQLGEATAKLTAIEKEKLTDLERAQAEAKAAKDAAAKASAEALRYRIAAKHQISDEDAELFLTGSDEETLARQAERLTERTSTNGQPRPDPSQGTKGGSGQGGPADLFAAAFKGRI